MRFSKLHPDGTETDVREIDRSTIMACPHLIMVPEHYWPDSSCKCDDPDEQARMIAEWGYSKSDFPERNPS
jgi:hypothetical protein